MKRCLDICECECILLVSFSVVLAKTYAYNLPLHFPVHCTISHKTSSDAAVHVFIDFGDETLSAHSQAFNFDFTCIQFCSMFVVITETVAGACGVVWVNGFSVLLWKCVYVLSPFLFHSLSLKVKLSKSGNCFLKTTLFGDSYNMICGQCDAFKFCFSPCVEQIDIMVEFGENWFISTH